MTTKIRTFGGNLGIGTTDPGSYRLRVDGGLKSTSMEVAGVTNAHIPSGAIAIWHGLIASIPTGWYLCNGSNGTPDLRDKMIRAATGDAAPSPTVLGAGASGSNSVTMSADQLPTHNHQVSTNGANSTHAHYFDGSNAPHGHGSQQSGRHSHNLYGVSWRRLNGWDNMNHHGSGTGGWAVWPITNNTNPGTGNAATHYHSTQTANAPHGHNSNGSNAPHNHATQIGQAGGNSSLTVTNTYRSLYYIMKT
jgi:hypothetical protein